LRNFLGGDEFDCAWLTLQWMRAMYFLAGLLLGVAGAGAAAAKIGGGEPEVLANATQMIVVTTEDWSAVQGRLQRYERGSPHQAWQGVGKPVLVVVGKNGLGWGRGVVATDGPGTRRASDPVKKEGDGRAPAGVFDLGSAFGYAAQPLRGLRVAYLPLTQSIECVDDQRSKYYNRIVDRSAVAPDWNSSERMRSVGEAYRWGIVVGQNGGADQADTGQSVAGDGSCVFLHIWSGAGRGTAGCTAMAQGELETLLTWLKPARKPLLVQLPAPEYARFFNAWRLPPIGSSAHQMSRGVIARLDAAG
jgi:D-alanyl-D-alanine dipeptidase